MARPMRAAPIKVSIVVSSPQAPMEGDALVSGTAVQGANDRSTGHGGAEASALGCVASPCVTRGRCDVVPGFKRRWKTQVQVDPSGR